MISTTPYGSLRMKAQSISVAYKKKRKKNPWQQLGEIEKEINRWFCKSDDELDELQNINPFDASFQINICSNVHKLTWVYLLLCLLFNTKALIPQTKLLSFSYAWFVWLILCLMSVRFHLNIYIKYFWYKKEFPMLTDYEYVFLLQLGELCVRTHSVYICPPGSIVDYIMEGRVQNSDQF